MARYFFDTKDGDSDTDENGVELVGDDEAVREAVRFAGCMVSDQPEMMNAKNEFVVTARSAGGRVVAQVRVILDRR